MDDAEIMKVMILILESESKQISYTHKCMATDHVERFLRHYEIVSKENMRA